MGVMPPKLVPGETAFQTNPRGYSALYAGYKGIIRGDPLNESFIRGAYTSQELEVFRWIDSTPAAQDLVKSHIHADMERRARPPTPEEVQMNWENGEIMRESGPIGGNIVACALARFPNPSDYRKRNAMAKAGGSLDLVSQAAARGVGAPYGGIPVTERYRTGELRRSPMAEELLGREQEVPHPAEPGMEHEEQPTGLRQLESLFPSAQSHAPLEAPRGPQSDAQPTYLPIAQKIMEGEHPFQLKMSDPFSLIHRRGAFGMPQQPVSGRPGGAANFPTAGSFHSNKFDFSTTLKKPAILDSSAGLGALITGGEHPFQLQMSDPLSLIHRRDSFGVPGKPSFGTPDTASNFLAPGSLHSKPFGFSTTLNKPAILDSSAGLGALIMGGEQPFQLQMSDPSSLIGRRPSFDDFKLKEPNL